MYQDKEEKGRQKNRFFAGLFVIASQIYGAEDTMLQYVVWTGRDHRPGL